MIRFKFGVVSGGALAGVVALLSASALAGLDSSTVTSSKNVAGQSPQSLSVSRSLSLDFSAPETVKLQTLATERQAIARVESGRIANWTVTPAGTEMIDAHGKRLGLIAAITSREVRPQVVTDAARGTVWFYGEDLYRYRAATGEMVRFRPTQGALGVIRKVAADGSGVWLATENGVAVFDDTREQFSVIQHPQARGQQFVQAAAVDGAVWFVQEPSRLIRLTRANPDTVQLSVSARRLPGVVAGMLAVNQSLWFLTSANHGDSYQLAFLGPQQETVRMVDSKVYSLREHQGRLLATTHNSLYTIDPVALTFTTARLDPARSLARLTRTGEVLFVGSSYGVKDNCEVVEHRRADISRGWMNPALDLYAPVRTTAAAGTR